MALSARLASRTRRGEPATVPTVNTLPSGDGGSPGDDSPPKFIAVQAAEFIRHGRNRRVRRPCRLLGLSALLCQQFALAPRETDGIRSEIFVVIRHHAISQPP